MNQRKLAKTIESIFKEAPKFASITELLVYALEQIIANEYIEIVGGRIWKLNDKKDSYVLVGQVGDITIIDPNYTLKISDVPIFIELGRSRVVMGIETDEYLKERGIHHYSAMGVGERYKIKKDNQEPYILYEYIVALNGLKLDDEFLYALNIISTTLSSIIRSQRIESEAKENIQELRKASEIQQSILPEHNLTFGNYDIYGISLPDKIVGGDFFDYLQTKEDDKLSVVIADAASKGISAAVQALYVSGALKMGIDYDINLSTLVRKIGNLVGSTFPNERFVTLFICELYYDKKGLCVFVNAGHNSPYHYIASSGDIEELLATGPVLGPSPDQRYRTDSTYLGVGDILALYTDGLVEAANKKFEFFGDERLKAFIKENKDKSAKEICQIIMEEVLKFSAKGQYSDDKTLVIIKRVQ
ncbi:MAG: PP2C family protein-serine/threonine phosphatase [Ignavibacteria bacterium]